MVVAWWFLVGHDPGSCLLSAWAIGQTNIPFKKSVGVLCPVLILAVGPRCDRRTQVTRAYLSTLRVSFAVAVVGWLLFLLDILCISSAQCMGFSEGYSYSLCISLTAFLIPFMKTLETVPDMRKLAMINMIPASGKICQNVAPVPVSAVAIPTIHILPACFCVLSVGSYVSPSVRKSIMVTPAREGIAIAKEITAMIAAVSSFSMLIKLCKMRRPIASIPPVYMYCNLLCLSSFCMFISSWCIERPFWINVVVLLFSNGKDVKMKQYMRLYLLTRVVWWVSLLCLIVGLIVLFLQH